MRKIDIPHVLQYTDKDKKERTENRLKEIIDLGMVSVGYDHYGVTGLMSGLYIEMVWSHSEEEWKDYIEFTKNLIQEKLTKLCSHTNRPLDQTTSLFALCNHDFYKLIKLEENLKNLKLSNQPKTKQEVERFLELEPANKTFVLKYQYGMFITK